MLAGPVSNKNVRIRIADLVPVHVSVRAGIETWSTPTCLSSDALSS